MQLLLFFKIHEEVREKKKEKRERGREGRRPERGRERLPRAPEFDVGKF